MQAQIGAVPGAMPHPSPMKTWVGASHPAPMKPEMGPAPMKPEMGNAQLHYSTAGATAENLENIKKLKVGQAAHARALLQNPD